MKAFTVPKIEFCPEQNNEEWLTSFVDFLLTSLLQNSGSVLRASDDGGESIAWSVDEEAIARTPRQLFRMVLARFGHHYMDDQLYAGHALVELRQGNLKNACHFYLGNCGQTGFWIEVYARAAPSAST